MKTVFISCPMRDRTDEQIEESMERMKNLAEALIGEKVSVVNTIIDRDEEPELIDYWPIRDRAVWYLGQSIKRMHHVDYYMGFHTCGVYPGCDCEFEVAKAYRIPNITIPNEYIGMMMPDVYERIMKDFHSVTAF